MKPFYEEELELLEKQRNDEDTKHNTTEALRYLRLENFKALSELQTEHDLDKYRNEELKESFLNEFFTNLTSHISEMDNAETVFEDIDSLEEKPQKIKSISKYNRHFDSLILDKKDCFDGVDLVNAVAHFNQTSSSSEIVKLGNKYNLTIPRYWKKSDLQKRLKDYLVEEEKLTVDLEEQINTSNVEELKVLLDQNNLDSKVHITKRDMIDIILKCVDENECLIELHDKPVLNIAKEEVKEEPVTKEEPIVKEEPLVIEEPVVVPQQIIQQVHNPEYENLLKQIIKNQEIIISQNEKYGTCDLEEKTFKFSRIFNIVILILIVVVAIIWITYGFEVLFS